MSKEKELCDECGESIDNENLIVYCEGCGKKCCDYCVVISETGDDCCWECMEKLEKAKKKEKKNV